MANTMTFKILIGITAMLSLQSCNQENQEDNDINTLNVSYEISLDNQNRFLKIDCSLGYTITYEYNEKTIVEKKSYSGGGVIYGGASTKTYYINHLGLADSCFVVEINPVQSGERMIHFTYNQEGFLDSDGYHHYEYAVGNRVKAPDPSYGGTFSYVGFYYEHSNMQNVIDIEDFNGSYLGKLNRNLISKIIYKGKHGSDWYEIDYTYALNPDNKVIQRTAICSNPAEK